MKNFKSWLNQKNLGKFWKTEKSTQIIYNLINDELEDYSQYLDEVIQLKLKGHTHFKLKETTEKIVDLINQDDRVLTISTPYCEPIGMKAVELGLTDVAIECLKNNNAAIYQNEKGYTIPMFAICLLFEQNKDFKSAFYHDFERLAIASLDNWEASKLRDKHLGRNTAMFCASVGYEDAVIKSLENPETILMKDRNNDTIAHFSSNKGLSRATMKMLEIEELRTHRNKFGQIFPLNALYQKSFDVVLKALEYEDVRNYSYDDKNFAMYCVEEGFLEGVLKAMDYDDYNDYVNSNGENLLIYATDYKMFDATQKGIERGKNLLHQTNEEDNIGHRLAKIKDNQQVNEMLIKLTKNHDLCMQKNASGHTFGMRAAKKGNVEVVREFLKDEEASLVNGDGLTIGSFSRYNGLLEEYEIYGQIEEKHGKSQISNSKEVYEIEDIVDNDELSDSENVM